MVRPLQSVSPAPYRRLPNFDADRFRSLAPKYEELAALYKDHTDKVTIVSPPRHLPLPKRRSSITHAPQAATDATANDVPDEVQGFPTIKLYPAGAKDEPVEYQGDRTVEDLVKFVKEHGKHAVDVAVAAGAEDKKEDTAEAPLGKAAEAATEKVKEVVSEAAEAVKSAAPGTDEHDEL